MPSTFWTCVHQQAAAYINRNTIPHNMIFWVLQYVVYCSILLLYFIDDFDEKVTWELFLEKPPDTLICAICLDIVNTPVQANCCGKLFCKVCQENSIKQDDRCPYCRNTMKVFEDKRCQLEINALKLKCPYHVRDCAWSGCVSDLKKHLENCHYKLSVIPAQTLC